MASNFCSQVMLHFRTFSLWRAQVYDADYDATALQPISLQQYPALDFLTKAQGQHQQVKISLKREGKQAKGVMSAQESRPARGYPLQNGPNSLLCHDVISSSSLSANGILLRYQLAIGGVTEAQAAPSATMGGAKTALMGATQNAAQMAAWQSSRSSW